jgi:hypothetical protein
MTADERPKEALIKSPRLDRINADLYNVSQR